MESKLDPSKFERVVEIGKTKIDIKVKTYDFFEETVEEVLVESGRFNELIEFDEPVDLDKVDDAVLTILSSERVRNKQKELELPSSEGYDEHKYNEDSAEIKLLLMINMAPGGIVHTHTLDELESKLDNGSCSKNLKYNNHLDTVATDGSCRYYRVTTQGMRKIIGVFGVGGWKGEANDVMNELGVEF